MRKGQQKHFFFLLPFLLFAYFNRYQKDVLLNQPAAGFFFFLNKYPSFLYSPDFVVRILAKTRNPFVQKAGTVS